MSHKGITGFALVMPFLLPLRNTRNARHLFIPMPALRLVSARTHLHVFTISRAARPTANDYLPQVHLAERRLNMKNYLLRPFVS